MRGQLVSGVAILAAVAGANMAYAQSGPELAERSYPVGNFEKVAGSGSNHFLVSVGDRASVRASGPARTLDHYEVVVKDNGLQIKLKDKYKHDKAAKKLAPATYRITLPRISEAALAGSGDMSIDRVDGKSFSAALAGSGKMSLPSLSVGQVDFAVAGSGDLTASGQADEANVSIAGSGNVRARGLRSRTASVSVAGSGDTDLTVSDDADISIVGSGDVDIAGTSRCSVSRLGSGKANCRG